MAPALAQVPAFPRNESFKGKAASNFSFGGAARLTGVGGTGNDAVGEGYLRLTDSKNHDAGYVIDNVSFPSSEGFSISFEFFSYGGTGADGFSVFLVDADKQPSTGFRIGATGGSLGYAQKTVDPVAPGVSAGYIGIGIDEFGNYSNGYEGRSGGSNTLNADGRVPDGVAIRGAGNGSAATDYPYLVGTKPGDLDFSLDVATERAQSTSEDYRRAYIDVVPVKVTGKTAYRITVRIQHGSQVRTTVENFTVDTPPANLRLGFSGSTGGNTNVHEIRNLNIVQVPFAGDDIATTDYDRPVTVRVLDNDVAPGSSIDANSVDLDPATPGQQTTLELKGKGTFSVNKQGVVSFTPSLTFAGTVVVPYTMQSILGSAYSSSPANITLTVQGADVAATISGPITAKPGEKVTYTITGSNTGKLTAQDVVLSLQLPKNLAPSSVVPTSDGTYDPATGLVTFTKVNSLGSGAPAVSRQVAVTLPNSGPLTMNNVAMAESAVPDPDLTNNAAAIKTGVSAPLPVELTRFVATAVAADAKLSWTTASERNSKHFEIERSLDGRTFERLSKLPAQGNKNQRTDYVYTDANVRHLTTQPLYYRLRQVDLDGKEQFSSVQVVRFTQEPGAVVIYPNPAATTATLDLSALPAATYAIQICDALGRVVLNTQATGGQHTPLAIESLPRGLYLLRLQTAGLTHNLQFVRE
ncbi:T9SS type A sorting domain-containing protein [Hymenobacter wooponensis]|uniref:T9SS type A sorting domain-containing protein n=1 Tax=Hymenobacter wooponensis TaxID=1525360 RepID=UPI0014367053|nr:T9SS type A sorting domain-containing protein [Hymenobacter wooponensis]